MAIPALTLKSGTTFTTAEQQVELLYVAYFGRAGDPVGVQFWIDNLAGGIQSIEDIAKDFARQDESIHQYQFLETPSIANQAVREDFVNSIFNNLFNRQADAAGLAYWTGQLATYQQTLTGVALAEAVGAFVLAVAKGAQNDANHNGGTDDNDATTLANKVAVAAYFTDHIVEHGIDYRDNQPANIDQLAHDVVDDTTSAAGSVATQEAVFDNSFGIHQDFTHAVNETLTGSEGTDIFTGIVDVGIGGSTADDNTLTNVVDKAVGGEGQDTLHIINLNDAFGTHQIAPNAVEVETVQITDLAPSGNFNLGMVPDIEHIIIEGSTADIEIFNIQQATDLTIRDMDAGSEVVSLTYVDAVDPFDMDLVVENTHELFLDIQNTDGDDIVTALNVVAQGDNFIDFDEGSLLTQIVVNGEGDFSLDLDESDPTTALTLVDASGFNGDFGIFSIEAFNTLDVHGATGNNDIEIGAAGGSTVNVDTNDGDDFVNIHAEDNFLTDGNNNGQTYNIMTGLGNDHVFLDGETANQQAITVDLGDGDNSLEATTGHDSTVDVTSGDGDDDIDITAFNNVNGSPDDGHSEITLTLGDGVKNVSVNTAGDLSFFPTLNAHDDGSVINVTAGDNPGTGGLLDPDSGSTFNLTAGINADIDLNTGNGFESVLAIAGDDSAIDIDVNDGGSAIGVLADDGSTVNIHVGEAGEGALGLSDPPAPITDWVQLFDDPIFNFVDNFQQFLSNFANGVLVITDQSGGVPPETTVNVTAEGANDLVIILNDAGDPITVDAGAGDDTVFVSYLEEGVSLDGGDGSADILALTSAAAAAALVPADAKLDLSQNFEALAIVDELNDNINLVQDFGHDNINHISLMQGYSGDLVISGLSADAQIDVFDESSGDLTVFMNNAVVNVNDNLNLLLSGENDTDTNFGTIHFDDIESVTINSTTHDFAFNPPDVADNINHIGIDGAPALEHVILTGDVTVDFTNTLHVDEIDAEGFTGGLNVTIDNNQAVTIDASETTGDTQITMLDDTDDTITLGTGQNIVNAGYGQDNITWALDTDDHDTYIISDGAQSSLTLPDTVIGFDQGDQTQVTGVNTTGSGDVIQFDGPAITVDYYEVAGSVAVQQAINAGGANNNTLVLDTLTGDLYGDLGGDGTIEAQIRLVGVTDLDQDNFSANVTLQQQFLP
jgi:hypothetical protein